MSNYKKHFERELKILEDNLEKGDNLAIKDFIPDIESIIEKFSKQGHSGSSAPFYAGALSSTIKNILLFKPLAPITGKENEWNDVGETLNKGEKNGHYQNKRLSAVFKDGKDGKAYYLDAIVWSGEDEHDNFTGGVEDIESRQYVKFPFRPKTFYIDVKKEYYDGKPEDTKPYYEEDRTDGTKQYYKYIIKDRKQLEEVFEYYENKTTH